MRNGDRSLPTGAGERKDVITRVASERGRLTAKNELIGSSATKHFFESGDEVMADFHSAGNAVGEIDHEPFRRVAVVDGVRVPAAVVHVIVPIERRHDPITSHAAKNPVATRAIHNHIVTIAPEQQVVAVSAAQMILTGVAEDHVIAVTAK